VPTVVPFQANFVSSAIAIANGRLYFTYKINACDADDFALASCSLATLANGTCVPQIHAAHFGLLGTRVLTVGTDVAFVTAQDGNTYRIPL
jgi:hypothetical protein